MEGDKTRVHDGVEWKGARRGYMTDGGMEGGKTRVHDGRWNGRGQDEGT